MNVLLIEDNPGDRRLIAELLSEVHDNRVELELVGCLTNAAEFFARGHLDVILLDLTLPEVRGLDTFRRAKEQAAGIPIIVLTGADDAELACQAVREGAQDYLIKDQVSGALLLRAMRYAVERNQAEEALRQERDFAENLIAAAEAIVLVVDRGGRIVRFNCFLEQISGYRLEEIWGQDWFETLLPAADRAGMRQHFSAALERKPARGALSSLLTKAGGARDVEWLCRTITDGKQNIAGVLLIGRDITEWKQAQERALRSERLAAIGQMVAGLAHESRNALQRSQACLERLALRVQDRPEALDLVGRIQKAQDHLAYLYEQVREYAAPINLRLRNEHLGNLLDEVWSHLVELRHGRQVNFTQQAMACDLALEVDRDAIEEVFRNVLENALHACSDPVEILVDWKPAEFAGQPALEVAIRDNGPGLSPKDRELMFEPFYTTKTHGTGLGMAIAKRIVDAHGGRIAIGQPACRGAEILITLPRRKL